MLSTGLFTVISTWLLVFNLRQFRIAMFGRALLRRWLFSLQRWRWLIYGGPSGLRLLGLGNSARRSHHDHPHACLGEHLSDGIGFLSQHRSCDRAYPSVEEGMDPLEVEVEPFGDTFRHNRYLVRRHRPSYLDDESLIVHSPTFPLRSILPTAYLLRVC